jgi:hypothetical protein
VDTEGSTSKWSRYEDFCFFTYLVLLIIRLLFISVFFSCCFRHTEMILIWDSQWSNYLLVVFDQRNFLFQCQFILSYFLESTRYFLSFKCFTHIREVLLCSRNWKKKPTVCTNQMHFQPKSLWKSWELLIWGVFTL